MTTQSLINHYIARRRQEECNVLRDKVAERLLRESPNGFYGLTAYSVKPTIVREHKRKGYNAIRL